ncbi:MAG: ABC transporter permease subunit [Caldilineaceae bacterium]
MRQLQLLDSVFGLALLNATFALPFPVIILSQMFRELPIELEEAAQVDGASRWQAFYRVWACASCSPCCRRLFWRCWRNGILFVV